MSRNLCRIIAKDVQHERIKDTGNAINVSLKLSKVESTEKGSNAEKERPSSDVRGIVGCLKYLALTSRPDVAYAGIFNYFFETLTWRH